MHLTLHKDYLSLQMEWYEQLWAFTLHNPMEIPLGHIVSVTTAEPHSRWTDFRAPGTYLPGVIRAGTYYTRQGKEFWYVTADESFLVLALRDRPYQKVIITISDNEGWAERLNQTLGQLNPQQSGETT